MSLIFDTHAHYDDHAFDKDRKELLSGLLEKNVGMVVNASAAARNIPEILKLTREYDFLYGASGLHPCEVYGCGDNMGKPVMYGTDEIITPEWIAGDKEMELVTAALDDPKIVAVGEIGLDYHYEDTRKDIQKEWFARQIALARKADLPVIVHSRDAAADTLDMIKSEKASDVGGIIHCFSYGKELAREYLDMGFMLGTGGVVTYKNSKKLKEVVTYMPVEQMVLETDCPYLCPEPFRGKRNDSSMLKYVVQVISQLKGISEEEVVRVTEENAKRVYRI